MSRPGCDELADIVISKMTYKVHPDWLAPWYKAYKDNSDWSGSSEADNMQGNNRKVQAFSGKRLIFIKDISATALAASFVGAVGFIANALF
jgi:hypothetical protein